MVDPLIQNWRQLGTVFVWTYTENSRNYPGWHLTADRQGSESIIELCNILPNLRYGTSGERLIRPPTKEILSVPNNKGGKANFLAVDYLTVTLDRKADPTYFGIQHNLKKLTLIFGVQQLSHFETVINNMLRAEIEQCLSTTDGTSLWVWRFPAKLEHRSSKEPKIK